jgi:hypothetical protein
MVDGRAYGFAYDDVGGFESLVNDGDAQRAGIIMSPFGAGGTQPPVTQPPVTQPPVTQPPVTQPPVTQPPVTQPPAGGTTWAAFANYTVGQVVTYNGVSYRCRQAHTAFPGWEPPNVLALWMPV